MSGPVRFLGAHGVEIDAVPDVGIKFLAFKTVIDVVFSLQVHVSQGKFKP